MQKQVVVFLAISAMLISLFFLNGLVNAAPSAQEQATETPRPTRDPIRQATRRATRGLPPLGTITPEPTNAPTAEPTAVPTDVLPLVPTPEPEDAELEAEAAEAVDLLPTAPGPMTSSILIFNPDPSGPATVQVDVYGDSGAVTFSTTVLVSSNGAKVVDLPGSLGTGFQGGAQISSDKNVEALVIGSNSNKSARDAYTGTTVPALDATLDIVRHLAVNTQRTLIAIQNTTGNPADVTVTFYNQDGSTANTVNRQVAAHKTEYLNTDMIFANNTFLGSARISSNENIAVAAQVLYVKDPAAFAGMTAAQNDTLLILNQALRKFKFQAGAASWSEIYVRNNGDSATDVTLDFYANNGTLMYSTPSTNVAPNGMALFSLKDADFDALGANFNGWVKIQSSGQMLTVSSVHAMSKGKRLYSVNATPNSAAKKRYVCGNLSRTGTQNSRLAILNTSSDPAAITKAVVRLYDKETGAILMQTKVVVLPNTNAVVSLSDSKFAAAGTDFQGMAMIMSKGGGKPNLIVSVSDSYMNPKASGTTGYTCTPL